MPISVYVLRKGLELNPSLNVPSTIRNFISSTLLAQRRSLRCIRHILPSGAAHRTFNEIMYSEWIKVMTTVPYFWHGYIHSGTTFLYLQYSHPLIYHFCQMFGRRRTPSARPSLLMFSIDRPITRVSSFPVLYRVPRRGSFTLEKRS